MAVPPISDSEYADFVRVVDQLTGIVLDQGKKYLVETRIGPLLQQNHIKSYRELLNILQQPGKDTLREQVIDAITTNETFFFREPAAIDLLRRRLIPTVVDQIVAGQRKEPMRIWSAACSSGQEMYSIAISAMELLGNLALQYIKIDGTDISEQILARASLGVYSQFEINRGLPAHYLQKYFTSHPQGFRIKDELRAMCRFNKANLLRLGVPTVYYDVIFCRNVSIYFSPQERERLFRKLGQSLVSRGVLIVGATEQVRGCDDMYTVQNDFPGCFYYRRNY